MPRYPGQPEENVGDVLAANGRCDKCLVARYYHLSVRQLRRDGYDDARFRRRRDGECISSCRSNKARFSCWAKPQPPFETVALELKMSVSPR